LLVEVCVNNSHEKVIEKPFMGELYKHSNDVRLVQFVFGSRRQSSMFFTHLLCFEQLTILLDVAAKLTEVAYPKGAESEQVRTITSSPLLSFRIVLVGFAVRVCFVVDFAVGVEIGRSLDAVGVREGMAELAPKVEVGETLLSLLLW